MGADSSIQVARDAHARRDWLLAFELLTAARAETGIGADDHLALADAAWWLGRVDDSIAGYSDAYEAYLRDGRHRDAAMAACGVAVNAFLRGQAETGSGWIGRSQRLLEGDPEAVENGYLRYMTDVEGGLDGPDFDGAIASAREVRDIGRRHGDPVLVTASLVAEGRALAKLGNVAKGLAILDEAMLEVVSGQLPPDWAGNLYCHMMAACHELGDVRRLAHWMDATTKWLDSLPAAVLFAGICRVHRSQVMLVLGDWDGSEIEAERVTHDLAEIHVASAAEAHYQVGEVRRLRGDFTGAEAAYRRAHERGRDPQPGMALLRLAEGRARPAAVSIAAALAAQPFDRLARFGLRVAQVEVAVAIGDLGLARAALDELEAIAVTANTSGFLARARQASGLVLLAESRAEEALPVLRDACRRWLEIEAPLDVARVRVLLAGAYVALDDSDAAEREVEAAEATMRRLGATADLRALDGVRRRAHASGLSAREIEVLRLVSAGRANREVADRLVISEKTVARHLSNIFTKLDVSSRTEAAAVAHDLGIRPDAS